MTKILEEFMKLNKQDQRNVASELMSIVLEEESSNDLTIEQNQMLLHRLEAARKNPDAGNSWKEVRAQIKNRA